MAHEAAATGGREIVTQRVAASGRLWPLSRARRKATRIAAVAIAAATLLELLGLAGWWAYAQWRLGHIELITDGTPLTVQVLGEYSDEPIGEPVHLDAKVVLALPAGDYRLRVDGVGRLGQTYRFAVNRGETIAHPLSLDEGRLLGREHGAKIGMQGYVPEEPLPFAAQTHAMELTSGKADLVEWTGETMIRRDASTGKPVWDTSRPTIPYELGSDPTPWLRRIGTNPRAIRVVENAADLDSDGTRDLLVVLRDSTAFLALSGKDGSMLWDYTPELDGPGGPRPEGPDFIGPVRKARRRGHVLGVPALGDVDRDSVPDVIATLIFEEFPAETQRRHPELAGDSNALFGAAQSRRIVIAISGRSGRWLWSHPIDPTFATMAILPWNSAATLVHGRRAAMVATVVDSKWTGLDPATGRPQFAPIDMGFQPVRRLEYADLDGDGELEMLALGFGPGPQQQTVAAFSCSTGRQLWGITVRSPFVPPEDYDLRPDWPLLADLDGDGRSEVVLPYSSPMNQRNAFRGVQVLDGASGRTRWVRPMRPESPAEDGLSHLLDAPDLDGDGTRDLVAVSRFDGRNPAGATPSEPERVYVDALSGRDGHPLWFWHADLPDDRLARIWAPRWWGHGPDGWPMLAVTLGGRHPDGFEAGAAPSRLHPPTAHMLEASTGREVHAAVGLTRVEVADLDGDGISDLWGEADGQLRAFRGETPEAWRALGTFDPVSEASRWDEEIDRPATDLDGDGTADAMTANVRVPGDESQRLGSATAVARSGRDGHLLWKTALDPPRMWYERDRTESFSLTTSPLPDGDLDGDGTPDVLVQKHNFDANLQALKRVATVHVQALSGRSGRPLWSAGPLPLAFRASGYSMVQWAKARVIEPNASADVLVRHDSAFLQAGPSPPPPKNGPSFPAGPATQPPKLTEPRLARLSGRDGRVLWDMALTDEAESNDLGRATPPRFADLDGDGALDVVIVLPPSYTTGHADFELTAVSLRDGGRLWSKRLEYRPSLPGSGPQLAIADFDGDERPEILVTEDRSAGQVRTIGLEALDGRTGSPRWSWRQTEKETYFPIFETMSVADFGGKTKDAVYVSFGDSQGDYHVVALDAQGRERARRDLPRGAFAQARAADLDGDGREELWLTYQGRLHFWDRELRDLWSWPNPEGWIERMVPEPAGRPGSIVFYPSIGLDGAARHPRWAGLVPQHGRQTAYWQKVLDPGDSTRMPLIISNGAGATVCRSALRTDARGAYAQPLGTCVPPGLARDDPRWARPLPWIDPILHTVGPSGLLAVFGLALVNTVVPIGLLWLAARRRPWTLRLLMALPVAAAVPLWVFQSVERMLAVQIGSLPVSARLVFVLGTLAGLPIVVFAGFAASSLFRRRWKSLGVLFGLTIVASAIIGAAWLWIDSRTMPAIEYYGRSGGWLIIVPGAYASGTLLLFGWILGRPYRWLMRPRRPEVGTS